MTSALGAPYISDAQFGQAIEQLERLVSTPSVSDIMSPDYSKGGLLTAVHRATEGLKDVGCRNVERISVNDSVPYIIGDFFVDATLPTVLLYTHYDQKGVVLEKRASYPFTLQVRDECIYGRGANGDGAGLSTILAVMQMYKDARIPLPCNVKVLLDGEKRIDSPNISTFLQKHAQRLHANVMVIFEKLARNVNTGPRADVDDEFCNFSIRFNGGEKRPHSAQVIELTVRKREESAYSDPTMALAALVKSLVDERSIRDFLPAVPEPDEKAREVQQQSVDSVALAMQQAHLSAPKRHISITDMNSGKPDGGNLIQDTAQCAIAIETPLDQNPDAARIAVISHLYSQKVLYNLSLTVDSKGEMEVETYVDRDPAMQLAALASSLADLPIAIVNMNAGQPHHTTGARLALCARISSGQDPRHVQHNVMKHMLGNEVSALMAIDSGLKSGPAQVGQYSKLYLTLLSHISNSFNVTLRGDSLSLLEKFEKELPGVEQIVPGIIDASPSADSSVESLKFSVLKSAINSLSNFLYMVGEQPPIKV